MRFWCNGPDVVRVIPTSKLGADKDPAGAYVNRYADATNFVVPDAKAEAGGNKTTSLRNAIYRIQEKLAAILDKNSWSGLCATGCWITSSWVRTFAGPLTAIGAPLARCRVDLSSTLAHFELRNACVERQRSLYSNYPIPLNSKALGSRTAEWNIHSSLSDSFRT